MHPSSSPRSAPQAPSAALALLTAIVLAFLTVFLFGLAEAGAAATFVGPLFPFVVGGLGVGATAQAVRTWRALGALDHGDARRSGRMAVAFLALLIDLVLIGVAVVFVLLMVFGTGIS